MPQRPSGKMRPANGNGNGRVLYVGPCAAAGPLGMRESPSQSSMEMRLLARAINWLEPGQGEGRAERPSVGSARGGAAVASQRPYLSTRASTRIALVVPCTPHRSHQFESKSVVTHTFNFTLHSHAVNINMCTLINSSIVFLTSTQREQRAASCRRCLLRMWPCTSASQASRRRLVGRSSNRISRRELRSKRPGCGRDPSQRRGCRF